MGKYIPSTKLTTKEFIKRSMLKHGVTYGYDCSIYVNTYVKVDICCPVHGTFSQSPQLHMNGAGCQRCSKKQWTANKTSNTGEFVKKAIIKHGILFNYANTQYVNNSTKIIIECPSHGKFEQTPASHLHGAICPHCAKEKHALAITSTTEEFIEKAQSIHDGFFSYAKVNYINNSTKIVIICPFHGDFSQTPSSHLKGHGCIRCANTIKISMASLMWILHMENTCDLIIEKEYPIPNTKYIVDGFCEKTNTVYEFYGDYFHGNPKNHLIKTTDGFDLRKAYEKTIAREDKIKEDGYKFVSIWESDFRKNIRDNISNEIKSDARRLWRAYKNENMRECE